MFSSIEFFIVEAFRSFRRSWIMTMVAIATITLALVIFGLFLLLVINMGNIVGNASAKLDVAAYVSKEISLQEAGALQLTILKIPGVEKVDFISRAEAWKNFQKDFGEKLDLEDILAENPLPDTFSVKVRNPDLLPAVAKAVSSLDIVDEVRYNSTLINHMRTLIDAVRIGGTALVLLVSFATLLIVINTIRLTVLARETEIYIMKLVGATNAFVKWPFIIEGILIGFLGGVISFISLKFSYDAVVIRVLKVMPFLPLFYDHKVLIAVYLLMVVGGMALGMLGAYISVSKVLKMEV